MSRTQPLVFTNQDSFYAEIWSEFNDVTKCHHIPPAGGVGPKIKFWVISVKMTYQASHKSRTNMKCITSICYMMNTTCRNISFTKYLVSIGKPPQYPAILKTSALDFAIFNS